MHRLELLCFATMATLEASMIVEEEERGDFIVSHNHSTYLF